MTIETDLVSLLLVRLDRKIARAKLSGLNRIIFNLNLFADDIPLTSSIIEEFAAAIERGGQILVRGGYKDLIWTVSSAANSICAANNKDSSRYSK